MPDAHPWGPILARFAHEIADDSFDKHAAETPLFKRASEHSLPHLSVHPEGFKNRALQGRQLDRQLGERCDSCIRLHGDGPSLGVARQRRGLVCAYPRHSIEELG